VSLFTLVVFGRAALSDRSKRFLRAARFQRRIVLISGLKGSGPLPSFVVALTMYDGDLQAADRQHLRGEHRAKLTGADRRS
jgi:hypothetical protein